MIERDSLEEELDELEVTCPLDGLDAILQVRADDNPFEAAAVVQCSRFGDEPVTCSQRCLRYDGN